MAAAHTLVSMMGPGHALILHHGPPWVSARTDGPLNLPKHNLSCLPASPQTFWPGQKGQKALCGGAQREGMLLGSPPPFWFSLAQRNRLLSKKVEGKLLLVALRQTWSTPQRNPTLRGKCELHRRSAAHRASNSTGVSFLSLEVCKLKPSNHLPGMRCEEYLPWVVLVVSGMEITLIPEAVITTDIMSAFSRPCSRCPHNPNSSAGGERC